MSWLALVELVARRRKGYFVVGYLGTVRLLIRVVVSQAYLPNEKSPNAHSFSFARSVSVDGSKGKKKTKSELSVAGV